MMQTLPQEANVLERLVAWGNAQPLIRTMILTSSRTRPDGPDIEDNWAALFRTTALFRRVALEVGGALGYAYPQQVDDQVSAYLNAVWHLPPHPNT